MANMSNREHINLLTDAEVADLYSRPQFTELERTYYFTLTELEHLLIEKYTHLKSKLYFILQFGYFKATQQFYSFPIEDAKDDIAFIVQHCLSAGKKEIDGTLWKEVYRRQKQDILNHFGYKEWSPDFKPVTVAHLNQLIRIYPKGNDTLRELLVYFEHQKITIPSYRTIQDLFTEVFTMERNRLNAIMLALPEATQKKLDTLIKNDDGLSQINLIRFDQKDFAYCALKSEIEKAKQLQAVYQLSLTLLPSLHLSNNAIRYYASLVEAYTPSRLRKLTKPQQWLQVVCFSFYRYKEFMDNLITSFQFYVLSFVEEATEYAKLKEAEYIKNLTLDLPKLVEFIHWFSSNTIAPNMPYKEFSLIGFEILSKERQAALADFIAGKSFDRKAAKWEFYEQSSRRMGMYLLRQKTTK